MTSITFDTLKYAERLEEAGIPRDHAKAEAEALAEVLSSGSTELATRADINQLRTEIKSEFNRIEGELKLNRWMLVLVIAATVAPLLKTLFS